MKTCLRNWPARGLLVMLLLFPLGAPAETPVQTWLQRYPCQGSFNSVVAAVADGSNNVVIARYANDVSGGGTDYTLIEYTCCSPARW